MQGSAQVCISKKRKTRLLPKGGTIVEAQFSIPIPFSCKFVCSEPVNGPCIQNNKMEKAVLYYTGGKRF